MPTTFKPKVKIFAAIEKHEINRILMSGYIPPNVFVLLNHKLSSLRADIRGDKRFVYKRLIETDKLDKKVMYAAVDDENQVWCAQASEYGLYTRARRQGLYEPRIIMLAIDNKYRKIKQ